jgi:hypothetical protein
VNIEGTTWFSPEGCFGPRGCLWTFAGLVLLFPCRPNQLPAAWVQFPEKKQEDTTFMKFIKNTKNAPGRRRLFTSFLFLLGSTVRQWHERGGVRLLLFTLFLFCLVARVLFTGVSDIPVFKVPPESCELGSEVGPGGTWIRSREPSPHGDLMPGSALSWQALAPKCENTKQNHTFRGVCWRGGAISMLLHLCRWRPWCATMTISISFHSVAAGRFQ